MNFFAILALIFVSTALSWAGWATVITVIDPRTADVFGFLLFYGSLTFSLTGTFALIGFSVRSAFFRSSNLFDRAATSFRQGLLFALLCDGMLALLRLQLLTWYNAAFLIIAVTLMEFFAISRRVVKI